MTSVHIRLLRCMREYHTAGESVIFEQRYLEALIWADMS